MDLRLFQFVVARGVYPVPSNEVFESEGGGQPYVSRRAICGDNLEEVDGEAGFFFFELECCFGCGCKSALYFFDLHGDW